MDDDVTWFTINMKAHRTTPKLGLHQRLATYMHRVPIFILSLADVNHFCLKISATKCAHQQRDILLLVDGSTSVKKKNFKKVKRFLQKLVQELNVGTNTNRVALIQFSEKVKTKTEFGFDRYYEPRKISLAISKMAYHSGQRTMTGNALRLANEKVWLALVLKTIQIIHL